MSRLSFVRASAPLGLALAPALLVLLTAACGGGAPPKNAGDVDEDSNPKPAADTTAAAEPDGGGGSTTGSAPGASDDSSGGAKKDECTVLDEPNLEEILLKNACEVPNPSGQAPDMSKTLGVKVSANPPKVAPGAHADILVTFTNKSTSNLPLYFTIDPMPRFDIETYSAKGNRMDKPKNEPPPLPAGMPPREPGEQKTARMVLAPNGVARMAMGWDAVKMRWAPEKLKGTPPEKGYPKAAAGSLPKGKYSLKVVTPLTNVYEGIDHEVSQPRVDVVVGK